jgi:hypothetical protein
MDRQSAVCDVSFHTAHGVCRPREQPTPGPPLPSPTLPSPPVSLCVCVCVPLSLSLYLSTLLPSSLFPVIPVEDILSHHSQMTAEELAGSASGIEIHMCQKCRVVTRFPRYESVVKLCDTRTGRCGEWAKVSVHEGRQTIIVY